MNLSQLRTQIDRRTGVRQDIPATNAYINEALNLISNERAWPWLDAVQAYVTTVDDNTYPVAADYSETRTVNIGGVEAKQIYVADGDEFAVVSWLPDNYAYSIEWNAGVAQLQLYPTPPAGVSVIHRYVRGETLMSADQDTPLMPEAYHSTICDLSASMFLERIEPSRAQYYRDLANKGIRNMSDATQRKTNPGSIRVRPGFPF